jgi:hypothetical protein
MGAWLGLTRFTPEELYALRGRVIVGKGRPLSQEEQSLYITIDDLSRGWGVQSLHLEMVGSIATQDVLPDRIYVQIDRSGRIISAHYT